MFNIVESSDIHKNSFFCVPFTIFYDRRSKLWGKKSQLEQNAFFFMTSWSTFCWRKNMTFCLHSGIARSELSRNLSQKITNLCKFLEIKKTLQNSKCMTSFQGVLINCLINYLISLHLLHNLPSKVHIRIYHRVLQYDLP